MNVAPVEVAHYCPECCCHYAGYPDEVQRLAETYPCGYDYESVETYTIWQCGDPRGACDIDEEMELFTHIWRCGDCEQIHVEIADAIDCCT